MSANQLQATLYRVYKKKDGSWGHQKMSAKDIKKASGKRADFFINEIRNSVENAKELGINHLYGDLENSSLREFYLVHNPTEGPVKDIWETTQQKITGTSKVSRSAFELIRNFDLTKSMITRHSQGSVILSNVLQMIKEKKVPAAGLRLNYHGAAANNLVARLKARRIGATIDGYIGNPSDPVHQVVGGNAITQAKPWRLVTGILGAPTIFSNDKTISTHSRLRGGEKNWGPKVLPQRYSD